MPGHHQHRDLDALADLLTRKLEAIEHRLDVLERPTAAQRQGTSRVVAAQGVMIGEQAATIASQGQTITSQGNTIAGHTATIASHAASIASHLAAIQSHASTIGQLRLEMDAANTVNQQQQTSIESQQTQLYGVADLLNLTRDWLSIVDGVAVEARNVNNSQATSIANLMGGLGMQQQQINWLNSRMPMIDGAFDNVVSAINDLQSRVQAIDGNTRNNPSVPRNGTNPYPGWG